MNKEDIVREVAIALLLFLAVVMGLAVAGLVLRDYF